jgi:hypothetical protein
MLRLLHTADVHLGARHTDLGERAAVLRERQFAAFRTSVELAIAEKVDIFLIAGDLFDSNTQPRRSVERVAAELGRLARASIRTVIIPGTHDVYDGASIYRSYDLAGMARAASDWVVVLTPYLPEIVFPPLDTIVYGRVFDTKRSPRSPLAGLDAKSDTRATWKIGMVHGALSIPGRTDSDSVVVTEEEIAKTGWTTWPGPLALRHRRPGRQRVVRLLGRAGAGGGGPGRRRPGPARHPRGAGRAPRRHDRAEAGRADAVREARPGRQRRPQPAGADRLLGRHADSNLVFDVRLTGLYPGRAGSRPGRSRAGARAVVPALPHPRHVHPGLAGRTRRRRTRSSAPSSATSRTRSRNRGDRGAEGTRRVARLPAAGRLRVGRGGRGPDDRRGELADLREVLRLGRHLLEGRQVTL